MWSDCVIFYTNKVVNNETFAHPQPLILKAFDEY